MVMPPLSDHRHASVPFCSVSSGEREYVVMIIRGRRRRRSGSVVLSAITRPLHDPSTCSTETLSFLLLLLLLLVAEVEEAGHEIRVRLDDSLAQAGGGVPVITQLTPAGLQSCHHQSLPGRRSRGFPQVSPGLFTPDGLHEKFQRRGLFPYDGQFPLASLERVCRISRAGSFYQVFLSVARLVNSNHQAGLAGWHLSHCQRDIFYVETFYTEHC